MSTGKSCRLLVTTKCNLDCSYCCNKRPDIRTRFRRVSSINEIDFNQYDSVCISGGEPLLQGYRLQEILGYIHDVSGCQCIYLYTNGVLKPPKSLFRWLSGVNIGIHDNNLLDVMSKLKLWVDSPLDNIRLQVQNSKVTPEIELLCELAGVELVRWTMNECDQPNEDWYTLEEF